MATVSEVAFSSERWEFCPCCGLRRQLGRVNVDLGPGQERVRCIDCFFGPPQSEYSPHFIGEAIFNSQAPTVNRGQTGDVLRQPLSPETFIFEPHGNPEGRVVCTLEDLYEFIRYTPKPYSERTDHTEEQVE